MYCKEEQVGKKGAKESGANSRYLTLKCSTQDPSPHKYTSCQEASLADPERQWEAVMFKTPRMVNKNKNKPNQKRCAPIKISAIK